MKLEQKNDLTELVFILDRSGSMAGLESDTVGGFNATIEKQRKLEGKCLVSTVLFDNTSTVLHDRIDLTAVPPMTAADYQVGGCTALLDALDGLIRPGDSVLVKASRSMAFEAIVERLTGK